MANVPWHAEVRDFCEQLVRAVAVAGAGGNGDGGGAPIPEYQLAAEHAHSCCVLLAQKKYKKNDGWYTHIDYEKFHALVQEWYARGVAFGPEDFAAKTPAWAQWGAAEEGFAPGERRWRRGDGGGGAGGAGGDAESTGGCG